MLRMIWDALREPAETPGGRYASAVAMLAVAVVVGVVGAWCLEGVLHLADAVEGMPRPRRAGMGLVVLLGCGVVSGVAALVLGVCGVAVALVPSKRAKRGRAREHGRQDGFGSAMI